MGRMLADMELSMSRSLRSASTFEEGWAVTSSEFERKPSWLCRRKLSYLFVSSWCCWCWRTWMEASRLISGNLRAGSSTLTNYLSVATLGLKGCLISAAPEFC